MTGLSRRQSEGAVSCQLEMRRRASIEESHRPARLPCSLARRATAPKKVNLTIKCRTSMLTYPTRLEWRDSFERFCKENRIFLGHPLRIAGIYKQGQVITLHGPMHVEAYGALVPNHFFTVGAYSFATTWLPHFVRVGRYCSIAANVQIMAAQHPTNRITSSPVTYLPRWEAFAKHEFGKEWETDAHDEYPAPPVIGNDVWIGVGVLIKRGITIGDGAVIGAHAVVTRDVPPYAKVAGVPARLIGFRFSERQIERLREVQPWRYNYPDWPSKQTWENPEQFCDALEAKIESGQIAEFNPGQWDLGVEFKRIADEEDLMRG